MSIAQARRYSQETVATDCDGPLTVVETNTRDAIKCGKRTIAYLAIGAEAWGPLLAAATDMRAALELIEINAATALAYSRKEGNERAAAQRLMNIEQWPGFVALRAALAKADL